MRLHFLPLARRALACALLVLVAAPAALAQQNWRWANSLPASEQWKDVAYGNGLYVAVGLDATIATSPDTLTWTIRRMSTANMSLNGVAFANGRFVAAGMGTPAAIGAALIMTSTDGINWTINDTVASTYNAQFSEVLYGGGTWVVSGSGDSILTSTDGLNWTARSFPSGVIPGTGTYGAGKFVLSGNGNTVLTSPDGATWTRTAVAGAIGASSPFLPAVTYGAGKFVAVGRDSNFVAVAYTSTDATTWTQAPTIANASGSTGFLAVVNDGTKFVAAGGVGIFTSPDGNAWTKQTSALPSSARSLGAITEGISAASFANNQFFVLGNYGSITTSTDGATWTRRSTGTVNDLSGLVHDGTRFVATGAGGTVLTSTDGATWTQLTTGTTSNFGKLAYNGTRYVTAEFSGILTSTNLTSWTAVAGTTSERYSGLAYGNGRFVATLTGGTRTSTDGLTWSSVNSISLTGGPCFGAGVFVATSGGGGTTTKILSSTDGATWTDRTPAGLTSTSFDSVAYGSGRFVALTFDRRSVTSTDGITWTVNTLPTTYSIYTVQSVGGQLVARDSGYGASSRVTTDGVTWTILENSTSPNNLIAAMASANGVVVGVGASGMILRGESAAPVSPNAPKIATAPEAKTISSGGSVVFSVAATGAGLSYQWMFNGSPIASATGPIYVLRGATASNAGNYACVVTNSFGSTTSAAATLTLSSTTDFGRIINLSILTAITAADPLFTVGTVVGGAGTSGSKPLLIRAAGPSLTPLGVGGALADPKLEVFSGQTSIATNDNWAGTAALTAAFTSVGAFPYVNATSLDAAIYNPAIPAGGYTVQVTGGGGATGAVIAELYDATPGASFTATTPRLVNVSVLKTIPTGSLLTAGFVIGGSTAKTVLVRVIGPRLGLAPFNIGGVMADPKLDLYSGQTVIASNDNWAGDAQLTTVGNSVGAFAVNDAASKDAILVITLVPGAYTVQASPVTGTAGGPAIVEVYEVP